MQFLDLVEHAAKQSAQVLGVPARVVFADFGIGERRSNLANDLRLRYPDLALTLSPIL